MSTKAFSIIECLVSVLILTVLLTAGMAFFFLSESSLHTSVKHKVAVELANAKMEDIVNAVEQKGGSLTAANVTNSTETIGTYMRIVYVRDIETTTTNSGPEYKEVRVQANSTVADPAEQPVNLVTYFKP